MQGASLIAIGDNRYFRKDGELALDAGPFIHALRYAAHIEPVIVGKPSETFFEIVMNSVPCSTTTKRENPISVVEDEMLPALPFLTKLCLIVFQC